MEINAVTEKCGKDHKKECCRAVEKVVKEFD
jgi:hypothetical protein